MDAQPTTFTEWLDEVITVQPQYEAPRGMPRWQRIADLAIRNGGFEVHSWGTTGYKGGPFGFGLDQNDALALLQFAAFISGVSFVTKDAFTILNERIDEYYDAAMKAYEEAQSRELTEAKPLTAA